MRILVTGSAGYIGSVVVEELLRDGHDVVAYDNLSKGHGASVATQAEFVSADLLDAEVLRDTLTSHRVEAVIHMAASSLVSESVSRPAQYYHHNVTAGLALLDAMRSAGVGRLVFSSTAAVYGEPAKQPVEEHDPTSPTSPYGETKLAFERALHWQGTSTASATPPCAISTRRARPAGAASSTTPRRTSSPSSCRRPRAGVRTSKSTAMTTRPETARACATTSTS